MAARAAVADRGYSLTSRDDDHARLLFRYIIYKGGATNRLKGGQLRCGRARPQKFSDLFPRRTLRAALGSLPCMISLKFGEI